MNIFDPNNGRSINQNFRAKRFMFFKSLLAKANLSKPINIVDIGGFQAYWERMGFTEDVNITLVNINDASVSLKNFTSIKADACSMPDFADNLFEVAYSNSVIEHLYTFENQQKMAGEIRRVGKNYFVQTPYKYFPIEPHWLFPFFQFFPFSIRVFLTKNFNLGHYKKTNDTKRAEDMVKEVKLLSIKEMKALFPDGKLYKEKFFGFTKSISMYRFLD